MPVVEPLPLPLLTLIGTTLATSQNTRHHHLNRPVFFLNRHAHVSSIAALTTITLVFADALIGAEPGVFAALAWTLAIAAFLALAAALAAGFGGEVFFVVAEVVLEVEGGGVGCFAGLRGQGGGGDGFGGSGEAGGFLGLDDLARALGLGLAGFVDLGAGGTGARFAHDGWQALGLEHLGLVFGVLFWVARSELVVSLISAGLCAILTW